MSKEFKFIPTVISRRFEHGSYVVTIETDGEGKYKNEMPYRLTFRSKTNSFSAMMTPDDIRELRDTLEMLQDSGAL